VHTVVFHGAGGPDPYTDALLVALGERDGGGDGGRVRMVDWTGDSKDTLRGSTAGIEIGRRLAERFWGELVADGGAAGAAGAGAGAGGGTGGRKRIHVVGISVGAFAANSFARTIKLKDGEGAENYVQLTLLDPFTQKAILGIGYGARNFGKDVDYAQQYMNTDDPVPSTNSPLPHCATTDVTSLRPPEIFGHDWPLVHYTQLLSSSSSTIGDDQSTGSDRSAMVPSERRRERGSVEVL